jgi:hypothetical protein
VFNAWSSTAWQGTQRSPAELVLIVRGIARAAPTARMARELGSRRSHLLRMRHRLQHRAWVHFPRWVLPSAAAEDDAMLHHAGKTAHAASRRQRPAAAARQPK